MKTPTRVPEQHQKSSVLLPAAATARSCVAGSGETACMCMVNYFDTETHIRRQARKHRNDDSTFKRLLFVIVNKP